MKTFPTSSLQLVAAVGLSSTIWGGLALIVLSAVSHAMEGTITGPGTWLLTAAGAVGGAAGGWYTQPLLKRLLGSIPSRKPRSRP